jgi:protein-S-isoprenylcysteine O-methyltransferase Ste14
MAKLKKPANSQPGIRHNIMRLLEQVVSFLILTALLLFISAGEIVWPYAWLYLATSLLIVFTNSFILPPELIAERGRKKEDVERWDTVSGLIVMPWLALYLAAVLDFRWEWAPELTVGLHVAALAVYILGNALVTWAMAANRFFSTAVRIQFDRGHSVCSSGPYRYVRHPGYLGMILYILASPLILGSLWALLPALLTAWLFVVSTMLEEKSLHQKLPGYREYANRMRYRLIPGLW